MAEENRKDNKVQARITEEIKNDYRAMASERGVTLGTLVAMVLKKYWLSKKRKGEC